MDHIADRPDLSLQAGVGEALRAALGAEAAHVGVAAERGTVTLTGELRDEATRGAALAATEAVWGVHAVADDTIVRPPKSAGATDTDLAEAAQAAIAHAEDVPSDVILVEVTDHIVTLAGAVRFVGERLAAERAVSYLPGVARIDNRITVTA